MYSALMKSEKHENAMWQYANYEYLETWRKSMIQRQTEVLYTTLTKFNTPMQPSGQLKCVQI
jgi:hypothetical protein